MARNEEKARTQLGRIYAAKQEKLQEDKYYIPPLATLETAQQVKRYIPRIRRDISFCLRQIGGKKRFRDYKIEEFKERLDKLKVQYRRFNRKALQLDPNMISLPGKKHAYIPKLRVEEMKQRRILALEQNPNGFRHLYGMADLTAVAARPVEWDELETEEKMAKTEEEEDEDGEMEEGEEEAVDQFLADIEEDNGAEGEKEYPAANDPDFIPTPLMQHFKTQQQKEENKERAVKATGLTSLMGYGSSDSD